MGLKTVYVFFADGFEEIEALTPVDMLRRAGAAVTTVGITGKTVTGAHGIPVTADVLAEELSLSVLPDLLILPGGMPGASNLDASSWVDTFLRKGAEAGILLAAICAAPMILGKRGLLSGKRAVCYPGFASYLTGAEVLDLPAVRDGNIVTGRGMGAAAAFSCLLISALFGEEKTEEIRTEVLL